MRSADDWIKRCAARLFALHWNTPQDRQDWRAVARELRRLDRAQPPELAAERFQAGPFTPPPAAASGN